MTYEEHKSAVDVANPTPTLVWYLHRDDASHEYDDLAIAEAFVTFDGEDFEYELHYSASGSPTQYTFKANKVGVEDGPRVSLPSNTRTWAAAKPAIQAAWETHCEAIRRHIAYEAHVKAILIADGITYRPLGIVKLTGLTANAAALGNIPLTPQFSPDVLDYIGATTLPGLTITAVLPDDATIEWTHGLNAAVTTAEASFTLTTGENVIMVTVSRPEYTPTTYTLTITRS